MQFVENIENHLDLLQEMGKAGVPDTFIKEYQEEELLELSRKICRMDAKGVISAMDKQALGYLVHDQGFLDSVSLSGQEGCLLMQGMMLYRKVIPMRRLLPSCQTGR